MQPPRCFFLVVVAVVPSAADVVVTSNVVVIAAAVVVFVCDFVRAARHCLPLVVTSGTSPGCCDVITRDALLTLISS